MDAIDIHLDGTYHDLVCQPDGAKTWQAHGLALEEVYEHRSIMAMAPTDMSNDLTNPGILHMSLCVLLSDSPMTQSTPVCSMSARGSLFSHSASSRRGYGRIYILHRA